MSPFAEQSSVLGRRSSQTDIQTEIALINATSATGP
jgi:hypothetical protein